jgi:predicted Zn finger-like uncharacterized protein
MVITVTCSSCSSSFPVDSAKIPENGVSARCSTCGDVFRIEKPAEASAPPPFVAEPDPVPVVEEPVAAVEEPAPEIEVPAPAFEEPAAVVDEPAAFEEPAIEEPAEEVEIVPPPPPAVELPPPPVPEEPADVPPPVPEAPEAPAEPAESGFKFGKRDPTDKAKRLARVLVSDMIMYNADRHVSALENGTLMEDFEEEIDKSWKEFVDQVGADIADGPGRGFWTEALNDILAKGEQLF